MTPYIVYSTEESECKEKTMNEFSRELECFEEMADFFLYIISKINQKGKDTLPPYNEQDMAVMFLSTKILKSLTCLRNTINFGYYSESMHILRNVHETEYLCEYILKDPGIAKKWWERKRIPHSKVIQELSIPEPIQKMYGVLCDHTHSNVSSLIRDMSLEENMLSIRVSPIFRKKTAYYLIIHQCLLTIASIENCYDHFQKYQFIHFNSLDNEQFMTLKEKFSSIIKDWISYSDRTRTTEII
ncbi:MAG: hypothetical protein LUQ59_12060 [Methanothrix sp.]|nr:hypothetical protein [Methanothrix sp.]